MSSDPLIVLLTDFGQEDPFVGIMKGVISSLAPQIRTVDITHNIPPGDIQRAAIVLWMAKPYYPAGTIFLCVVDPGVGTERKGIILQDEKYTFIGPDNGLFSFILDGKWTAWELSNPNYQLPEPGTTFHGRDIFAPAAAYAAKETPAFEFGPSIQDIIHLPKPNLQLEPGRIHGEIIYVDQFGNLLTSLGRFTKSGKKYKLDPWLETGSNLTQERIFPIKRASLQLPNGRLLSWADTFADLNTGDCGILVGSSGLIEIAAYRNSALELTNLSLGDPVTLIF